MSEEKVFQTALTNFTFDVACGSAIRHMVDKGYTVRQVVERSDYPISYEKAQKAVTGYMLEKGILLPDEPDFHTARTEEVYVKEYGANGKASFRKIVRERTDAVMSEPWREKELRLGVGQSLSAYLGQKAQENGTEYSYVSCDFGIYGSKAYEGCLNSRQKEYIDGILWQRKRMYHRLDYRMREIVQQMRQWKDYEAVCYFGKTGEKVCL